MSHRVDITLAGGAYDRTLALIDGRVRPEGVALRYLPMTIEEVFWRALRHEEFDASELSLAYYITMRSRGDRSYIAIPVFPSRFFRHGCFYVPASSERDTLDSLRGATVGLPEYTMTACVWQRGLLADECGIVPTEIHWRYGGIEGPGRQERVELPVPRDLDLKPIADGATLNGLLADGQLDAVMAPRIPSALWTGRVRRLLKDYQHEELQYFRRTGLFPVMHVVAIRTEVYRRYPWVARSLFEAYQRAKALAYEWLADIAALPISLPWYVPAWEATRREFGLDPWRDGLEENRSGLETLCRYLTEQDCAEEVNVEELFAPNTLDEFVI